MFHPYRISSGVFPMKQILIFNPCTPRMPVINTFYFSQTIAGFEITDIDGHFCSVRVTPTILTKRITSWKQQYLFLQRSQIKYENSKFSQEYLLQEISKRLLWRWPHQRPSINRSQSLAPFTQPVPERSDTRSQTLQPFTQPVPERSDTRRSQPQQRMADTQPVPERSDTRRSQPQQQMAHTQPVLERSLAKKYEFIPDQYETLDQVTNALRESGLESSNLIVGIDFTKSNEWTGKNSFNGRSLHAIGTAMNPYEQAISIIGRTLSPFDEDNLIPCFGFGDATTHDVNVFSFCENNQPCHGFEQVLERYRQIVPHLKMSGPTSFAPVIEASKRIVEASGGQYHVLLIIADGQVTRSVDTGPGQLSPQEQKTIDAIATASKYALSIVLVGVGDGPWDTMRQFDDKLPRREFDNFQFVNFTSIMSKNLPESAKEASFALAALMEIPIQYKATIEFKILGRRVGSVPNIVPLNPPDAVRSSFPDSITFQSTASHSISSTENSPAEMSSESQSQVCPVCLTNSKEMVFGCGHMTCRDCSSRLSNCPICRSPISTRLRAYLS